MRVDLSYLDDRDLRLDMVLLGLLKDTPQGQGLTRSQISGWIKRGLVEVNHQKPSKVGALVKKGSLIRVDLPEVNQAALLPFDFALNILFEDEQVLVLDKPAGLSMHPGAGNKTKTLVNALVNYFGHSGKDVELFSRDSLAEAGRVQRPGIVHRLDKDTTGVVVVAKTLRAHNSLAKQFAERSISRLYQALVLSTPRANRLVDLKDQGVIDGAIGRHLNNRKQMSVTLIRGKRAVTQFRVLERMKYACLLELKLQTGRTHQIRVHMNHVQSPVIGDPVYGDFSSLPGNLQLAAKRFGRQALHAKTLEFTHPVSGKRQSFESPLPSDFMDLVELFRAQR